MSASISLSVANCVMELVDATAFRSIPFTANLYCRNVDDTFGIWNHERVESFDNAENNMHPTIQFTRETECDNTLNSLGVDVIRLHREIL